MEVSVEISNRHIHLTKETYNILFSDEINVVRNLSQKGEFVSDKVVTIIGSNSQIENVKVLGPFRSYDQLEVSQKDALKLGIKPKVRKSGDTTGTCKVLVKSEKGEVLIPCIIAQRHIHMTHTEAMLFNVKDNQKVKVLIDGPKSGTMDAYIKISDNATFMMHIDTDDAAAFLLNNLDKVRFEL